MDARVNGMRQQHSPARTTGACLYPKGSPNGFTEMVEGILEVSLAVLDFTRQHSLTNLQHTRPFVRYYRVFSNGTGFGRDQAQKYAYFQKYIHGTHRGHSRV